MPERNEIKNKETALLVGIILPEIKPWSSEKHLDELEQLAETAGADILGRVVQERSGINPKLFLGKGKIDEIAEFVRDNSISMVIFDDDLSPAQLRNLGNIIPAKIIDRSALILDIFASHAKTREAKTQVELAQLQYMLPRLTRQWTHLSRQVGGIGTKGPGETQLETDRRLIRTRIKKLKNDLEKIELQRGVRRKGRKDFFSAALVGYTNVGKSTVMKLLSGADILIENKLFATLDSTVRKIHLGSGKEILLSDTVGFIRKLPHNLVASFRSTLKEVGEADVLLHVVDVSLPNFEERMNVVINVLQELKIDTEKILTVFNKIDLVEEAGLFRQLKIRYPEAVFISAVKNMGIEKLKAAITQRFDKRFITSVWAIPMEKYYLRSNILKYGQIVGEEKTENGKLFFSSRMSKEKYDKMVKEKSDLLQWSISE